MKNLKQPSLKINSKVLLVFRNNGSDKKANNNENGIDTTTSTITITSTNIGATFGHHNR